MARRSRKLWPVSTGPAGGGLQPHTSHQNVSASNQQATKPSNAEPDVDQASSVAL
jgi:hypothetical protein